MVWFTYIVKLLTTISSANTHLLIEIQWKEKKEERNGKEMETHSSILAWKIPGTEEPGGL